MGTLWQQKQYQGKTIGPAMNACGEIVSSSSQKEALLNANIDLQQLRYFIAVVDAGSITKAARQCNIAQPALSKRIANLEYSVRVPLLHRSYSGIVPTAEGRQLYKVARRVLHDIGKVIDQVHSAAANPVGEVRVGCINSLARLLGAPLALTLHERFPGVRLSFVAGHSGDLYRALSEGLLDLAVVVQDGTSDNMEVELVLNEELFVMASPSLPGLPSSDELEPEALASIPFVFPTAKSFASGRSTFEALGRKGIALNILSEIDGDGIRDLIADAYAACVLPASFVESDIAEGRICLKRIKGIPLNRRVALCSNRERPLTIAARAVQDELKRAIKHRIDSGSWHHARIHC